MILIFGLILLVAAVIVAVAGVLGNTGAAHALTHGFSVFGYHVTGNTGTLFLYGIVVGAIAAFGLSLLLTGARRTSRRGHAARGALKQSRSETAAVSQDRDSLLDQRNTARADISGANAASGNGRHRAHAETGGRHHVFGRRPHGQEPGAQGRAGDQRLPTTPEPIPQPDATVARPAGDRA